MKQLALQLDYTPTVDTFVEKFKSVSNTHAFKCDAKISYTERKIEGLPYIADRQVDAVAFPMRKYLKRRHQRENMTAFVNSNGVGECRLYCERDTGRAVLFVVENGRAISNEMYKAGLNSTVIKEALQACKKIDSDRRDLVEGVYQFEL